MLEGKRLGFIGTGNMATALLKGLLGAGICRPAHIFVFDKEPEAVRRVVNAFGVTACGGNREVVEKSDLFLLAVKPQNIFDVLDEIRPALGADQLVISIAAGIPLQRMEDALRTDLPMIRVMPNTPALVQMGVSALAGNLSARPEHLELAQEIFSAVGSTVTVPEDLMDAVTAVSGSGPGYVFRIMEAMVAGAVSLGLDRETALALVVRTFAGAARLAADSPEPLERLRAMVTSPGGTTAAGLSVLEESGIEKIFLQTVQAAFNRARELGKG